MTITLPPSRRPAAGRTAALLAGAALVCAFAASPALAQQAAPAADTTASTAASTGDIVVTATREKSLLSKTPIALTAITGDALRDKGIVNPSTLGEQVPNLSIDRANGLQITIRGVTSTDGTEKGNPSAAFLADGVYLARPQEADISFIDVDHVEVLKGPQGTLYGRNTTAGVINVITKKPEFGKVSGGLNLGYGNYNAINADGYINLPATDWAAFRLSVGYDSRDTFIKRNADDPYFNKNFRTNASARLQGLFKLGDNGDLLIRGVYAKLNGSRDSAIATSNLYNIVAGATANDARTANYAPVGSTSDVLTSTLASAAFDKPLSYFNPLNSTTYTSGLSVNQYGGGDGGSTKPDVNNTTYGIDGEFNYNFGPVKVTYLGSARQYTANENSNVLIGTNLPGTFNGNYSQQSHELRLANTGTGKLKIQGGLYYFREESHIAFYIYDLAPFAFGNTFIYGFPQHTISTTKGAFTQATYKVLPTLRLTAGIRYTKDDLYRYGHTVHVNTLGVNATGSGAYSLDPNTPDAPGGPTVGSGRSRVNDGEFLGEKATWRIGFDADVAKGLLYGSIATGYKEGGFGDGCSTGGPGEALVSSAGERCDYSTLNAAGTGLKYADQHAIYYKPETITDYELGYRGTIAPGVKIDTNLFYYDYKGLQLSAVVPVDGALQTITTNAGKASVLGWEFETQLAPVEHLNVKLGLDVTDGHYREFCPSGLTSSGCGANSKGQIANYAGQKLDRTPSTVLYGDIRYTVPVGEGDVVAAVSTRYASAYSVTVFGDNGSYWLKLWTPAQSKTQASVTYNSAHDRWSLSAYIKNIENHISLVSGNASSLTMSDPRTYGVRASVHF